MAHAPRSQRTEPFRDSPPQRRSPSRRRQAGWQDRKRGRQAGTAGPSTLRLRGTRATGTATARRPAGRRRSRYEHRGRHRVRSQAGGGCRFESECRHPCTSCGQPCRRRRGRQANSRSRIVRRGTQKPHTQANRLSVTVRIRYKGALSGCLLFLARIGESGINAGVRGPSVAGCRAGRRCCRFLS